MNDSKCKSCGEPMQWIGTMLGGELRCTTCEDAPKAGTQFTAPSSAVLSDPAERARGESFSAWWSRQSEEEKYKMFGEGGASLRARYLDSVARKALLDGTARVVFGPGGEITFVSPEEFFVDAQIEWVDASSKWQRPRSMDGCECGMCQYARKWEANHE